MKHPLAVAVLGLAWTAGRILAADTVPALPAPADTLALMERVADWQLAHPASQAPTDWVQAAGYTGFMALSAVAREPRYFDAMLAMGRKNGWKPGPRLYHADDLCVTQTYAELYFRQPDPAMLAPTEQRLDTILAHPPRADLTFEGRHKDDNWSWCDSLFMAPPAWVRFWKATGRRAYLDYAVKGWWHTSDFLYDRTEHLFYRDSRYMAQREANGQKVFWSRGNGWVFAGLARVLEYLPENDPTRPRFERQFREMAARIVALQPKDGFWRSSLLDPASFPEPEASGTAFFCFGLAWGINHGLLDRPTYLPALLRGWAALVSSVQPDGKLVHVQPVGADPRRFDPNSTEPYGVGGFLLTGTELYRMAGGTAGK